LDAKRDWGHARDYVEAMWLMLQAEGPEDFVVGTGECHSVREFLEVAFDCVGLDYREFVVPDSIYFRPTEIYNLVADASKARVKLGWKTQYRFADVINEMVDSDLKSIP
jgi:GDPmannose 4,6-dehydratase